MYVNVSVDADDLECVSVDDVVELFDTLDNEEQELFFKRIGRDTCIIKKIRDLFYELNNNEVVELLNELNSNFKSDKEWQEIVKNINED
ncbi:hypothetical protein UPTC5084_00939 [Campylobacter lari]|uniref:hypothetical protein n=1 Tax=Campylobacter lari TaxID=201 RepID=UPI002152A1E8|nr:hypothetical protein [Campylobacter lari]MCR6526862.1 hypothetical protein [Campylobacter lari]